jgi:hypothetical protein
VIMTSVAREGGPPDVDVVADAVLDRFLDHFGYTSWRPLEAGGAGVPPAEPA